MIMPPMMVAGLTPQDVDHAVAVLRERGVDIVEAVLGQVELDEFFRRGGLLIWITNRGRDGRHIEARPLELQYAWLQAQVSVCHRDSPEKLAGLLTELMSRIEAGERFLSRFFDPREPGSVQVGSPQHQHLVLGDEPPVAPVVILPHLKDRPRPQ